MSSNEMKYIQKAFDTNWVVSLGPNVNGFEEDLKQFVWGDKKMNLLLIKILLIPCRESAIK